jgi:type III secretory pathway component EscV/tetratricopeptide (TPR) repeat protein
MSGEFNARGTPVRDLKGAGDSENKSAGMNRTLDATGSNAAGKQDFLEWTAIETQIGHAEDRALQRLLMERRTHFVEELLTRITSDIETAFRISADYGWQIWLSTLAETITMFRFGFCTRLCEVAFSIPESKRSAFQELTKAAQCMRQGRWPEVYQQLDYLVGHEFLTTTVRARLFVILGQIQLFHFQKPTPAKQLFDRAVLLAADDPRVISAIGDYWLGEQDDEKAISNYKRAIELAPEAPYGYGGMGEYFEKRSDFQAAEEWYKKAILAAPGDNLGYGKLFRLYGQAKLFKDHEGHLPVLLERIINIDPEDAYQIYRDFGDVYNQTGQLDKAQEYYEKAITLDGTRPSGYVALAQVYEKQNRAEEAETTYKKAIDVAPTCYDGYWGLTSLYEQQGNWQKALEWYKRGPLFPKEWAGIARAKVGEMHAILKHYDEAERILEAELRIDIDNVTARAALEALADSYNKDPETRSAARRVYGEVLEILGESYRSAYYNRLGNLSYFHAEYEQAAEEYRRAIAAAPSGITPDKAVFHRNLASVYKFLKEYSRAGDELNHAFRIDSDKQRFDREVALLRNDEANDYYTRGDYRKAIETYRLAIENDPNDAVIQSNLAKAWELLDEPGGRAEAFDNAIEALKCAQRINPAADYRREIERVGRKKTFAAQFGKRALDRLHVITPITVEVARDLIPYTESETLGALSENVSRAVLKMRTRLWDNFGVKTPGVRFRGNETDLSDGTYVITLMGIPFVAGTVQVGHRFCLGSAEMLTSLGVGTPASDPLTGSEGFWIEEADCKRMKTGGVELWDVLDYLIRHLEFVLQRTLTDFLGHDEVAELLLTQPTATLEHVRSEQEKFTSLVILCRSLLAERVPITRFDELFEVFDNLYEQETPLRVIAETVRSLPLRRSRLPGNNTQSAILPLGPRLESEIRKGLYQSGGHSVLAMKPEPCQTALTAVRNGIGDQRHAALMVEDAELRPFVRMLIELEFPEIPVLARPELSEDLQVKTSPVIELEEEVLPETQDFRSRGSSDRNESKIGTPESAEIAITVFTNEPFRAERSAADGQPIQNTFSLLQDGLFYELGIVLPEVNAKIDTNLKPNQFRFRLNGIESPVIEGLASDEFLVNDTADRLALLQITARAAVNPANGTECAIVREEKGSLEICRQAGLTIWGPDGFLVLYLATAIRKNAATFQNILATEHMLDSLRGAFPNLVDTAMKRFSTEHLCLVLRDLLDEEISIRDMRSVLESMLSINGTTDVDQNRYIVFAPRTDNLCPVTGTEGVDDLSVADHSNFVRTSLKRYISHKYTRGSNTLVVYLIDRAIEERLSNVGNQPMTNEEITGLIKAVRNEIGSLPSTAQNPVLLTTMDIRKTLKKLVQRDFPNLTVLSYQELSPDLNIQPIARISWD